MILLHFLAVACQAYDVFYVLRDDSINSSCSAQPCIILNNNILPATINVEYRFLPGEYHFINNIMLQNLSNFALIGNANISPAIILNSNIYFAYSCNVTIMNIVFKSLLEVTQYSVITFNTCFSCRVKHVTLIQYGLACTNLIGQSHLNNITIHLNVTSSTCYQIILLQYWDLPWEYYGEYNVIVSELSINGNDNACLKSDPQYDASISIFLYQTQYGVDVLISNSLYYNMDQRILSIKASVPLVRNSVIITNCKFYFTKHFNPHVKGKVIIADLPQFNMTLSFLDCIFYYNQGTFLIVIKFVHNNTWYNISNDITCVFLTNITINGCYFIENIGGLLHFRNDGLILCRVNIFISGPVFIDKSSFAILMYFSHNLLINITGPLMITNSYGDIFFQTNSCGVLINGPVTILNNYGPCFHLMYFRYSTVLFNGNITFELNQCEEVINIESFHNYAYIKIMEFSVIKFTNNVYSKLITLKTDKNHDKLDIFCPFQFITLRNMSLASTKNYAIIITDKSFNKCKLSFHLFISHCKWVNKSVFYGWNSGTTNQKIIQINHQPLNQHTTICHYSNCAIDTLGVVFPGQTMQTELFMPCSNNVSVLYAETHNALLPNSACKIAHQNELTNVITNFSGKVNFTIISEANQKCELFLTVSPFLYQAYEAFFVQLLPCPIGFTLQNGVCDCDPHLPTDIDTCSIDHSTIRRPENKWIMAQQQSNNTKYLISDCPMDYCLQYSLDVNLLYPDAQCQFNRTGILCSKCQNSLSMVFGSSRCMECTNFHILISIVILVAGIILVFFLYLLNLTVTKGAINGIIFYANIVSINNSVFLVNDGIFKPLRVFISFVNLDLGFETCFYNGMDSYAKMWLQLFFPIYLITIAIIIIVASRYSLKLLRLTFSRSLPVLATLFLLSYTGVLRTTLTVLFSYSTITHLPSGHKELVWSIDASVPLFGFKFAVIYIMHTVIFAINPFQHHFAVYKILDTFQYYKSL